MPVPEFWIVAGPNGAGKTTTVQREPIAGWLPDVTFLNPDDLTLQKLRAAGYAGFADAPAADQLRLFIESANEVSADLDAAIAAGRPVGIETVLSSDKYQPAVEAVLSRFGVVGLIYVAVSSPDISRRRIADRVRRGGHGVPDEKIAHRWQRSLDLLPWFAGRATQFWVVDNSPFDMAVPPRLLASGGHGRLEFLSDDIFPEMAAALTALPR